MSGIDLFSMVEHFQSQFPEAGLLAEGWEEERLEEGAYFCRQGDPAHALALIVEGELRTLVDGEETGRRGPGELVGEASVFFRGEKRMGSLQARVPTRLLLLSQGRLMGLRQESQAIYDSLLMHALQGICERIHAVGQKLAALSASRSEFLEPSPSLLSKLWSRLGKTTTTPPPCASQFLRTMPMFHGLQQDVVDEIAGAMEPLYLEKEQALLYEGEQTRDVYAIARGSMRALKILEGQDVHEVGAFGARSVVGAFSFLRPMRRTATVVAAEPSWVLALSHDAYRGFSAEAARAWHECLLMILRSQLLNTGRMFHEANKSVDFASLLAAQRQWEAWTPEDAIHLASTPDIPALTPEEPEVEAMFRRLRRSIIGGDLAIQTPFGARRMVYADYTASGRNLDFIEEFLQREVMPFYANTHTEASLSGLQTTRYREEARELVARSVGAGEGDVVLFVGSGATGAIHKLIDILNLRLPPDLDARFGLSEAIPRQQRPVVFYGPYEHHSNILPWKHSLADAVMIPLDAKGLLDVAFLEAQLELYQERPLKIGSFSAASNVTGIATDTLALATLLHRHGALSFWDYAAAGPYTPIEMNPSGPGIDASLAYKDAVFLSPHKFLGGPGTPGVLVVKRELVQNAIPTIPGGGTVDFVTPDEALYSDSIEHREEAGTPAILESIRCGLVFQLKDNVGAHVIHRREKHLVRRAIETWQRNPAIRILGNLEAERLSIVSLMLRHGKQYLHHNFAIALLNDLFGIQARGGCSCAGPYGGMLLGLDADLGKGFLEMAGRGWASLKPGWTRLNFNYFISEPEFRYLLSAVHLIALYGYALLPRYRFEPKAGLWHHRDAQQPQARSLSRLWLEGDGLSRPVPHPALPESALLEQLSEAQEIFAAAQKAPVEPLPAPELPEDFEALRWFPLPHEVAASMHQSAAAHRGEHSRLETYREALRHSHDARDVVPQILRQILEISPDEHDGILKELASQEPR